MSRENRVRSGELGASLEAPASSATAMPDPYSAAPAISDALGSGSGISFSSSKVRRLSSTMNILIVVPMAATRTLTHQGRPSVPIDRPTDCRTPDTVGPTARHALAADAAAPFKDPSTLAEGDELASMIALDGKANACAVTFQTNARYTHGILSESGTSEMYGTRR